LAATIDSDRGLTLSAYQNSFDIFCLRACEKSSGIDGLSCSALHCRNALRFSIIQPTSFLSTLVCGATKSDLAFLKIHRCALNEYFTKSLFAARIALRSWQELISSYRQLTTVAPVLRSIGETVML
jgi:hypothetical protein